MSLSTNTLLETNISFSKGTFQDDVPFPVGCVSSLEDNTMFLISALVHDEFITSFEVEYPQDQHKLFSGGLYGLKRISSFSIYTFLREGHMREQKLQQ